MKGKEELLAVRRKIKKKKPKFRRQEWFRMKRVGDKWRKPRGIHSKLREHRKTRGALPRAGYRSPAAVRGLTREGYREILVRNLKDMAKINRQGEIAVIASAVGKKKRLELLEYAQKNNIKVGNKNRFK